MIYITKKLESCLHIFRNMLNSFFYYYPYQLYESLNYIIVLTWIYVFKNIFYRMAIAQVVKGGW